MYSGFVIGDRGLSASGDTHPSWMIAHAEIGSYRVIGASAIGQSHLERELPRDDAFVVRAVGPWLAIAVSDGVGSRPLSRYGASYVVESLTTLLLRRLVPPPASEKYSSVSAKTSMPNRRSSTGKRNTLLRNLAPPATTGEVTLPSWMNISNTISPTLAEENASPASLPTPSSATSFSQASSTGWWPSPHLVSSLAKKNANHPQQFKSRTGIAAPSPYNVRETLPLQPDTQDLTDIVTYAFTTTHRGLLQHARGLDVDIADLSCTALALLLNTHTGQGIVGQVGDGAILALSSSGVVQELGCTDEENDPQSTYTINKPDFSKHLTIKIIEQSPDSFVAFYVMTDGLSGDLLFSSVPPDTWARNVERNIVTSPSIANAANGMLRWLSTYRIVGSDDDRTLVVLVQKERTDGNSHTISRQP